MGDKEAKTTHQAEGMQIDASYEFSQNELLQGYLIFRLALRDALGKIGEHTNPISSDREIVAAITKEFGIDNTYDAAYEHVQRRVEDAREP